MTLSSGTTSRRYAPLPVFDPADGIVVLSPEHAGPGYWVGCPGVLHEPDRGRLLLTYRQRRPRGEAADRGWRCAIASSSDGVNFADVWSVEKHQLGTSSMERFCLLPTGQGEYDLFVSYVDPADNRWRIDRVSAGDPAEFDVGKTEPVLTAASTGTEGVKDPYVIQAGPVTYLFASYAEAREDLPAEAHDTADIYNVGATTHPTGLASSLDRRTFTWHGSVLRTGGGWDRFQARLNSIVPTGAGYVGFYDGSASHAENYEERCGVAVSHDLHTWQSRSTAQPWLAGPNGTGSVRYVDASLIDGEWWIYYELARPDGAHDLRLFTTRGRSGTHVA